MEMTRTYVLLYDTRVNKTGEHCGNGNGLMATWRDTAFWAQGLAFLHIVQNLTIMIMGVKRQGEHLVLYPPPFENGVGGHVPSTLSRGRCKSVNDGVCVWEAFQRWVQARLRAQEILHFF